MHALRPYQQQQPQDENSVPGGVPVYRQGDLKSIGTGGPTSQCTPQPYAGGSRNGSALGGFSKQVSVAPQSGAPRRALGNITNVSSTPAKKGGGGLSGATPAKGGGLGGATPSLNRRALGNIHNKGNSLTLPSASKGKRLQLYDEGSVTFGASKKGGDVSGLSSRDSQLSVPRLAAQSTEVDALAERYAQDGVESLAGAGWKEQERERRMREERATMHMDGLIPSIYSQLAREYHMWEAQDKTRRAADGLLGDDLAMPIPDIPLELKIVEPAPPAQDDELTVDDMQEVHLDAGIQDTSELAVMCE